MRSNDGNRDESSRRHESRMCVVKNKMILQVEVGGMVCDADE